MRFSSIHATSCMLHHIITDEQNKIIYVHTGIIKSSTMLDFIPDLLHVPQSKNLRHNSRNRLFLLLTSNCNNFSDTLLYKDPSSLTVFRDWSHFQRKLLLWSCRQSLAPDLLHLVREYKAEYGRRCRCCAK